jgi:hypothetical protein
MGTFVYQMFEAALGYYNSGHFAEAEQLSRQILSIIQTMPAVFI